MRSRLFDPHKALLDLAVLRLAVLLIVLNSAIAAAIIISNSSLQWKFSWEGFNAAVNIFQVPLGVLALVIPVVALLASNHRSEQAREQMRLASSQNDFANHYKHIEEFGKYCETSFEKMKEHAKETMGIFEKHTTSIPITFEIAHVNPRFSRSLYRRIYPNSRSGDYRASLEYLNSIDTFILSVLNECDNFATTKKPAWIQAIYNINKLNGNFEEVNYIRRPEEYGYERMMYGDEEIRIPGKDITNLIRVMSDVVHAVDIVLQFDVTYTRSALVEAINKFDPQLLPERNALPFVEVNPFDIKSLMVEKLPELKPLLVHHSST